ncbi:hypothetical protein [Streptobacillus moniliformis]|uniref:Uncharacterized protein n=1 Tax=Streptobacillus moniliformis (strain ATCC 14647 / DSM 12112 / NCTC 10651 / 9901) TaxID=519441 RepID=D1AXQ7_STRM9|nr:hypothetical protein [Streptobacillus moniliformis]ACZ01083.1 hypothetical protein Smon_0605 [Streptobacillus moniliformis DSM 12112]AVL42551.1 hypothetical protein CEP89_01135 [Streptobacillus moniliformis]QXW65855.1 hypothetical protein KX935_00930 [Streptobacillus moniliformis]SQA13775.1 Uncharacterised protein [Streptobacillus moniliformis]
MLENEYIVPKFSSRTVLRSVDLFAINQNINSASFLKYIDYEEGVILGLHPTTNGEKIFIDKGIYKFDNEVIFLTEKISIDIPDDEGEFIVYIMAEDYEEEYTKNKKIYLKISKDKEIDSTEVVRFNLRKGATLKNYDYELKKFSKEYNSLNINEVRYSKTGINPKLLKIWSKKMMALKLDESMDLWISSLCNIETINIEVLKKYIFTRLKFYKEKMSNTEILIKLYEILNILIESNKEFDFDKKVKVE